MATVAAEVGAKGASLLGAIAARKKAAFLEGVVAQVGYEELPRGVKALIKGHGVVRSNELARIAALPRRVWEADPTVAAARVDLAEMLRVPGGTMELWPTQAAALIEAATCQGLFAPIGVGRGKALISLLAPVVMDARRPLLLVPAQLRDQTLRKVIPEMRRHWRLHPDLEVRGYSELSLAKNCHMLDVMEPDVIVLDECHAVKAAGTARTKRLKSYLRERPETRVVAMSGTVTRRSLKDYWHLLLWALKPDLAPIPATWQEMQAWADALDADADPRGEPGALLDFCEEGDEDPRDGYRRRLVQSPGVVATSESELGTSLRIVRYPVAVPGPIRTHIDLMRATWETPGGDAISEAVDLWRHARELACGFFYRWDPLPPVEWLQARKAWKRYVRETLRTNRRGLDSELLVAGDAERQDPKPPEWEAWCDVRDTFEPNTVPEWLDDYAVEAAAEWLRGTESEGGGICWIEHVAFGERLAAASGFPYFGAGAKASGAILDATGPIIASVRAHSEGKNLQRWARSLVMACPPSGKTWEQLLGRTHRAGQLADEVVVEVALHVEELEQGFVQAVADARYIEQTTGARQKLLYADLVV